MSQFDKDIKLELLSGGLYRAIISDTWNVNVGPNGGYIGAIILNGMLNELGREHRTRSITFHFLSASVPGEATLQIETQKRGRTLSTMTGKLVQGDRTIAMAIATFAPDRDAIEFCNIDMPVVPAPDQLPRDMQMHPNMPGHVAFRDHYDQLLAIGPIPPDTSTVARVGGWTRFKEHRAFDDLAIVAISDSWVPGLMVKELPEPMHAPTVDHTVHFMAPLPPASLRDDDFVLVEFTTDVAQDGYLVENGLIWAPDGTLLAQSRQLAIIMSRK